MRDAVTIAEAFPILELVADRRFAAVLANAGLTESDDVGALCNLAARQDVMEEMAHLLIKLLPEVPMSKSLPGVVVSPDETILLGTFSVRSFNALERSNNGRSPTWGELAQLCPAALFSFVNLGTKSVMEILATASVRSILALDDAAVELVVDAGAGSGQCERLVPASASAAPTWPASSAWRVVAQWLQESSQAKKVGDALEELGHRELPGVVSIAWEEICSVQVDALAPRPPSNYLDTFIGRLSESLGDKRVEAIFWERIAPSASTLEEIGTQLGVTRERVRQLQVKGETQARALVDGEFQRVRWRADALFRQLGTAFPTGADWADAAIASAVAGGDAQYSERLGSLLLWLAGPYRCYSDGWTRTGELPHPGVIAKAVDDDGALDELRLIDELEASGLAPPAAAEWIAQYVTTRTITGVTYIWDGSVTDKAAILLRLSGIPMTAEDLTAAIGEGHGVRSTRTRLLEDDRFKRVDRQNIGLRDWPMDEYTGIADEIAEEIERRGGACEIGELVAVVAQNYNLSPASVEAYTAAPRFVVEQRIVRFRRPDEPFVSRRNVTQEARCYLLGGGRCSFRMTVDRDILRGSGRPIPEGLGVWLGVRPGIRRVISFGENDIPVTWPDTALLGPSIGSLRRVVEELGVELGDWIVITFDREQATGSAALIDRDRLAKLKRDEQVSVLTGITWSPGEMEKKVSEAIGATEGVGLRERLRQRGEEDILALMPNRAAEFDLALDRLKSVL